MKPSGDGCNPWGCNVDDDEATPCMIYTGVGKAGTYRECAVLNYGLFYEFHAWDRLGCTDLRRVRKTTLQHIRKPLVTRNSTTHNYYVAARLQSATLN